MTIKEYFLKLKTLKFAQEIVEDINLLLKTIYNYNSFSAKKVVTYITTKYTNELNELAEISTQNYVVKGTYDELYENTTDDDIISELEYLYECLVVIGCVKFRFEKSYSDLLNNLN